MSGRLWRWGGIAAMLGGALWALTPLRQDIFGGGRFPESPIFRPYNFVVEVITILLRFFHRWYGLFGMVVAAAFLVCGATVAQSGFFAPDGGYGLILFWLFPLWLSVTSVVFVRRVGEPRSVEAKTPTGRAAPV